MSNYKIVPISKKYAAKIREEMKDYFGNEVLVQLATGVGPCRVSLKPFKVNEDYRLVFSHSPFAIKNPYNQPGPVFINRDEVEEYTDIYRFPPEIKADKVNFPISLIGYDKNQKMIFTRMVGDNDVDEVIEETFETNKEIEFLHARNSEAACFICKIERL